jgi:hypothetical protein
LNGDLKGDFRYVHMRVRENAESIAFYRGDDIEHQSANNKFQLLLNNRMRLIRWFWAVNCTVTHTYIYQYTYLYIERLSQQSYMTTHSTHFFNVLEATSNAFVYMGSVLNYAVVALPIVLRQMENPTNQYIAEASFQLIMLIQVLLRELTILLSVNEPNVYFVNVIELKYFIDRDSVVLQICLNLFLNWLVLLHV